LKKREPTNRELYQAAVGEQQAAEALRDDESCALGRAFFFDQRGFSALSRYEATLDRGVYRALHELERLQRLRAGEAVPPPLAVDVDVTSVAVARGFLTRRLHAMT
jgi:hypothetical protein